MNSLNNSIPCHMLETMIRANPSARQNPVPKQHVAHTEAIPRAPTALWWLQHRPDAPPCNKAGLTYWGFFHSPNNQLFPCHQFLWLKSCCTFSHFESKRPCFHPQRQLAGLYLQHATGTPLCMQKLQASARRLETPACIYFSLLHILFILNMFRLCFPLS